MKLRIAIAVILLSFVSGCKSPTTIEVCRQDIIDGNIYLNDCNIYEIKE